MLTLQEAREYNCCRLCGCFVGMLATGDHLVLNYGEEFAHASCLRACHDAQQPEPDLCFMVPVKEV